MFNNKTARTVSHAKALDNVECNAMMASIINFFYLMIWLQGVRAMWLLQAARDERCECAFIFASPAAFALTRD